MKQLSLIPIIIILLQSIGWGSVPAATSAPAATPTPAVSAPQVIGGDPSSDVTSIGGYAGIRVTYTKNGVAAAGFCNGVLVDSEWVLTAAYCMYPAGVNITSQPANVRVELGCFRNLNNVCSSGTLMLYGQPRQTAIVARQIVVHDQMTVVDGIPQPAYGVALIRLSTPAQTGAGVNVWTVAQSSDNPTAESSPYIVSYGNKGLKATATATRTQTASRTPLIPSRTPTNITRTTTQTRTSTATAWPEGIATSDVLKASIALINDGSCTLPGFSGATLWCANATAQGNELCYGDTGAPLVSTVAGQLAVFGISLPKVQFGGAHNCVMGMQSAMVDVTAPAIRTWIVNTIRATSPRGLNTSLGGSAGFGGEQLAPSDNDMTQVDVSSVFPSGIRIGTTVTTTLSVNANGVVALGDVKKLDKVINPATYTGAPLFVVFGADANPSLGAMKAPVGGKSSGANRVWVAKDTVNGVVTITWDDVRPAKGILSEQYIGNTFQVQFRRENTSDVRVTYRYGMLQWTFSETMCSLPGCLGSGNRVSFAQVGYVSGKAKGVGNLIHAVAGKDAMLRTLVAHEYVIRDGMIGPERPTATSSSTRTMTRTSTPTRTQTPTRTASSTATLVPGINPWGSFTTITTGYSHTCALNNAGKAYCWGSNQNGGLGNGTTTNSNTPVAVTMPTGVTFTAIVAGQSHTCARSSTGVAYCWGANDSGQLGNNTSASRNTPTAVTMPIGVTFTAIATGQSHTCALSDTGVAYCWGANDSGQLGNNTSASRNTPTAVTMPTGVTFMAIAAGQSHTCALSNTGVAYCWGANSLGQIGDGSTTMRLVPTAGTMPTGVTLISLDATGSHTCALTITGAVYCWGANSLGQIGDGSTTMRLVPTAVTIPTGVSFTKIATGDNQTCARTSSGTTYCWGANDKGQLGNGTTTNSNIPVAVTMPTGVTFTTIDTGQQHVCALNSAGTAYCWGWNAFAQLGVCDTVDRNVPVAVRHDTRVGSGCVLASTSVPTQTNTSTSIASMTPIATTTPTHTTTHTPTNTATHTPTNTLTSTATNTLTNTNTPTITLTSTPLAQGLTDGLLAWYPLNGIRTTGSTLPVQANTIMGAAQYFDGVNDYHQTTVDLANKSFTVGLWAAHDSNTTNINMINVGSVIAKNGTIHIGFSITGQFACRFYAEETDSPFIEYTPPVIFDKTQWHHYACSYDNDLKQRKMYIDGNLVATQQLSQGYMGNSAFYIGVAYREYAQHVNYFKGTLRDVMVYNRALTSSEINRIKDITPNSAMLSEPHPASACRWVDKGGMVHEYEINKVLQPWVQAKATAEARSRGGQRGYLATITNAAENDCLMQYITLQNGWLPSTDGPFIGGKRIGGDGLFRWDNGPDQGMMFNKYLGYVNWYGSAYNANDLNPDPRLTSDAMFILRSDAQQWNNAESTWSTYSIIEYTYPESHTISGVAYTDTNSNNQLDGGDFRATNQTITLTADLAQPIDIVGGGNQMCARLDDGRVVCWGRRGDSWRWDQQSAVPIEVDGWRDVRAISNGLFTSCALLANGTVSCLGKNSNGAVGDGSTTDRWTPVTVSGLSNVVALNSGGGYHHCAVLANTTVKCWGDNTYAQIGDGTYDARRITPATVVGLSGVAHVSVGERHTCARKGDGTVWCWGSNDTGQLADTSVADSATPRQIAGLSGIKDVRSGAQHVCVIRSDNQVACWGNSAGITGNRSGSLLPTVIENTTDTVSLSVGNEQSCVAKSDGTVWCWGHVFHGEAGWVATGTTTTRRSSAVQMPSLSSIVQVSQSANSACGRRSNGDVLCWGEANVGQLGDGTYQPRGIAAYVRITWQTNPYAARVAFWQEAGWGSCAILTDRRVACWGSKHPWWTSTPETTLEPGIINGLTDIVDLNTDTGNSCALKRNGTVWCWGTRMVASQFVNGVLTTDIPQMHQQRDVIGLSHGGAIRCFTASTGLVSCYKNDTPACCDIGAYRLPSGSTINSDVGSVDHAGLSSCYLKQSSGNILCWGDNTYFSQLGNGVANTQTAQPQKVNGFTTIQQIGTMNYHVCVLQADTTVKCWGQAIFIDGVNGGAAGTRGTSEYATPITIPNLANVRRLSSGFSSCAVKFDGTVWCWGMKKWNGGQFVSPEGSINPWQIAGITDAVDVFAGYSNICVLQRGGTLRCWGAGATGGLGNGLINDVWTPRPISEPWQANVNQGCEWVDWQGRRHSYESLSGSWTWTQARDIAAARTWRGNNGYLATITSPEENRCVHQLLLRQDNTNSGLNGWYPARWLGGSDADSEGTWKWMMGPEAGTTFREIQRTNYPQAGFSQFQTFSHSGCKPNCTTPTNWDYTRMVFPYGTHIQRNTWDDQSDNDPIGALVEYTTGTGETARTYTTTTDSQGNYAFTGLPPGVYTVQSTVHGTLSTQRVVIWPDQRDARVDFVNRSVTISLQQTMTAATTPTQTATRTVTYTPAP